MSYTAKVVEKFERAASGKSLYVGSLDKDNPRVGTGVVGAPACGDVMKFQIEVDATGKIIQAKYKTFGCGSAIASSDMLAEMVQGRDVHEACKIKNSEIAKELSLPPVKLHCSLLAEEAVKAAVANWREKNVDTQP